MMLSDYLLERKIMLLQLIEQIPPHSHPIWGNVFFYLFIIVSIVYVITMMIVSKMMNKKAAELKLVQQQQVAKVDVIRKEHSDNLEGLRIEMLKREEERTRQWMESEKETLHVLNGVSNLLDLTDKIGRVDSEKILKKLEEISTKVENLPKAEL